MRCKQCVDAGLESKVYPLGSETTCVYYAPFYDEQGNYHHHDANAVRTSYRCSNGHKWVEVSRGSCWCGWKGGAAGEDKPCS